MVKGLDPAIKDYLRAFGLWTEKTREAQGLTMTECAKRAKISVPRWKQIEDGMSRRKLGGPSRPQEKTVYMVADALGIPRSKVLPIAGYELEGTSQPNRLFTAQLDSILQQVPLEKRVKIESLLMKDAENYVSLVTPTA